MLTVLFINLMIAALLYAYQRNKAEIYAFMQNMLDIYWMSFVSTRIEMDSRESLFTIAPQNNLIIASL
jgi:hypothetical protein